MMIATATPQLQTVFTTDPELVRIRQTVFFSAWQMRETAEGVTLAPKRGRES